MKPPLPLAENLVNKHQELRSELDRALGETQPALAELADLVFNLLDSGAGEWAYQLASPVVESASLDGLVPASSLTFAWASAMYETHRWEQLRDFAGRTAMDQRLSTECRARVSMRAAWAELLSGDPVSADSFHKKAQAIAQHDESVRVAADLAFFESHCLAHRQSKTMEAHRRLATSIALYRLAEQPRFLVRALLLDANLCMRLGLAQTSRDAAQEALDCAAAVGNPALVSYALMALCIVEYRQGDFAESSSHAGSAAEIVSRFPGLLRPAQLSLLKVRVDLLTGDLVHARLELEKVEAELNTHPNATFKALLHEFRATAAIQVGNPHEALQELRIATELLDRQEDSSYYRAEVLSWEAEALLALNREKAALAKCDEALALLEMTSEVLDLGRVLRVRALTLAALGRAPEARADLSRSEAQLRKLGDLYELGCTLLVRSEHLAETPEGAVAAAAEALNLFGQMGVVHLADRARDLLALAQIRMRAQRGRSNSPSSAGSASTATDAADPLDARGIDGPSVGEIIASSAAMLEVLGRAKTFARHPNPVLLTGETGVGKEVVARFVHRHSQGRGREFVPVNCAAIPDALFEREFFGHVKGAFTGAEQDRAGLVEYADGGTLFLDEIGEMPLPMQAKLLRLVQDGTYRRVGEAVERRVQLRLVAATNRDLGTLVRKHAFREDLLYRLATFELEIPALRTRPEDVAPLLLHFLERETVRLGNELWMTPQAWAAMKRYAWPGNVRELESAVVCAGAQADTDGCIRLEHLPRAVRGTAEEPAAAPMDLEQHLLTEERRLILKALNRAKNSRAEAARALGIPRNTLYDKIKRLGIELEGEAD